MNPRRLIRKLKFDWHGEKRTVARVRGVSFVGVSFGGLAKETQVAGTTESVVGGTDGFGNGGDGFFIGSLFLLGNGDGLSLYRCRENMGESILITYGGGTKICIKNNGGTLGDTKGLSEFLFAARGLDSGGGGIGGMSGPGQGGLLASGITAFSTTAVSREKRARLKTANSFVIGSS